MRKSEKLRDNNKDRKIMRGRVDWRENRKDEEITRGRAPGRLTKEEKQLIGGRHQEITRKGEDIKRYLAD